MNQQQTAELEKVIISDYNNIAGIVVSNNRKTLYENYFNECTADTAVHVSSVTKSVISVLIGIAIDNGFIKSTEQKILDFFPDYTVKRGEKTLQNVSVKNMLIIVD